MRTSEPLTFKAKTAIVVGVIAVAGASTLALALTMGWQLAAPAGPNRLPCSVPTLPGSIVEVALNDAGTSMMGGQPMMVDIRMRPRSVESGEVSFVVYNGGRDVHELTVLPLTGDRIGRLITGLDGTVPEEGSLGHAEAQCATGEGPGIPAGGTSWLTLRLQPGNYEVICNEPGHYRAGMYEVLTVT